MRNTSCLPLPYFQSPPLIHWALLAGVPPAASAVPATAQMRKRPAFLPALSDIRYTPTRPGWGWERQVPKGRFPAGSPLEGPEALGAHANPVRMGPGEGKKTSLNDLMIL